MAYKKRSYKLYSRKTGEVATWPEMIEKAQHTGDSLFVRDAIVAEQEGLMEASVALDLHIRHSIVFGTGNGPYYSGHFLVK